MTGPEATGGKKEYGAIIANTWVQEIEKNLSARP